MGAEINYAEFIKELDLRLKKYFDILSENIKCKKGCSECCEQGDYPISDVELSFLMEGYSLLDKNLKIQVQQNIKNMEKGGVCPFLINKECSVYEHRPIICRVHGLAYFYKDERVKVPNCVKSGKNFANVFENNVFMAQPINANLDTYHLLEGFYSEIKNMYDWFYPKKDTNSDV